MFRCNSDHLSPRNIHWSSLFARKACVNAERVHPGHPIILLKYNKIQHGRRIVKKVSYIYLKQNQIKRLRNPFYTASHPRSNPSSSVYQRFLLTVKIALWITSQAIWTVSHFQRRRPKSYIHCVLHGYTAIDIHSTCHLVQTVTTAIGCRATRVAFKSKGYR